ncbi:hypothetical protein [Pseudooctadecabacter jejudonensis]|uniref:Uncharacterized protein n=1 Tax=Pseudooctadecabacter jejudonensis TaxID=1391910 RepID=A0A1Y5RZN7_9RHOB|nr:hypothetical protein [Pseudooctadecabacter jejudonensis]SLN26650.1 hypothetical protein PSJ8397_01073 [Pseudooctadecabacter jejudonensis]
MTGILKAILFAIPSFAVAIFAAFFARLRFEQWLPPSGGTWNAVQVSLLTLLTFAATMWLCSRLATWWLQRQRKANK